jgi:hypothetical protein
MNKPANAKLDNNGDRNFSTETSNLFPFFTVGNDHPSLAPVKFSPWEQLEAEKWSVNVQEHDGREYRLDSRQESVSAICPLALPSRITFDC